MKSLTWMVLSLFIVCLVASGLLSKVYTVTKIQIEKQISENEIKLLSDLLPEAKRFETIIADSLWIGYDADSHKVGIVFKTAPDGYAGPIPILVALSTDSLIKNIYIASAAEGLKETPGLGQKVRENKFKDQFINKTYQDIKLTKDGGKIQAITAATISSKAVVTGVRDGIERYKKFILPETLQTIKFDTILNKDILNRLSSLLPNATKFKIIIPDSLWLCFNDNNDFLGIVFKTTPEGFGGLIPIWVGYNVDQSISKIYIGSPDEGLKETPGYGQLIRKNDFLDQFINKKYNDLKYKNQGGSLQAISGATISSDAVLQGIKQGIEHYQQYIESDTVKQK